MVNSKHMNVTVNAFVFVQATTQVPCKAIFTRKARLLQRSQTDHRPREKPSLAWGRCAKPKVSAYLWSRYCLLAFQSGKPLTIIFYLVNYVSHLEHVFYYFNLFIGENKSCIIRNKVGVKLILTMCDHISRQELLLLGISISIFKSI